MPNKAWLTTAATKNTFPRLREPGYNAELHTVAGAAWGIPLLWLPLFRPCDLMMEDVTVEEGRTYRTYRDPVPVVEAAVALTRLADSIARLNDVFHEQGSLDRHAALIGAAIASTGRPFVTLEPEAVAWMGDPKVFYESLERALAYFEEPDTPRGRKALLDLTPGVSEKDLPFPAPDGFFDREDYEVEEAEMMHLLLGEAWLRPLPWDSRPCRRTKLAERGAATDRPRD
jgi:hypothetical protein